MTTALLLIGCGIILIALGIHFLRTHFSKPSPNEDLEWMGYGDHPFRKR